MQANSTNPIRVARLARGWSLRQFASKAGVHVQALYLNECGCYPHVLPRIGEFMATDLLCDSPQVAKEYDRFVANKRVRFGNDHSLDTYGIALLGEPRFHPILAFRESLGLSRMGFAKSLCVQPTVMYNVENCLPRKLPKELLEALEGAYLPAIVRNELCLRYEDWSFV